jgi:hypothetical protein
MFSAYCRRIDMQLRCQLAVDFHSLGPHSADEQKMKLQIQSNVLRRKISSWIEVQHLYILGLHVLCGRDERSLLSNQLELPVSNVKLYLPSTLTLASNISCDVRLYQIEWDLHQAQAQDALHERRDGLRLRSYVYMDKDCFQQGQRRNTHSRGLIDHLEVRVDAAAVKYRVARQAISSLAPPLNHVGWERNFPVLQATDI